MFTRFLIDIPLFQSLSLVFPEGKFKALASLFSLQSFIRYKKSSHLVKSGRQLDRKLYSYNRSSHKQFDIINWYQDCVVDWDNHACNFKSVLHYTKIFKIYCPTTPEIVLQLILTCITITNDAVKNQSDWNILLFTHLW